MTECLASLACPLESPYSLPHCPRGGKGERMTDTLTHLDRLGPRAFISCAK